MSFTKLMTFDRPNATIYTIENGSVYFQRRKGTYSGIKVKLSLTPEQVKEGLYRGDTLKKGWDWTERVRSLHLYSNINDAHFIPFPYHVSDIQLTKGVGGALSRKSETPLKHMAFVHPDSREKEVDNSNALITLPYHWFVENHKGNKRDLQDEEKDLKDRLKCVTDLSSKYGRLPVAGQIGKSTFIAGRNRWIEVPSTGRVKTYSMKFEDWGAAGFLGNKSWRAEPDVCVFNPNSKANISAAILHDSGEISFWRLMCSKEPKFLGKISEGKLKRTKDVALALSPNSDAVLSVGRKSMEYIPLYHHRKKVTILRIFQFDERYVAEAFKSKEWKLDSREPVVTIGLDRPDYAYAVGCGKKLCFVKIVKGKPKPQAANQQVSGNIVSIVEWKSQLAVSCDDGTVHLYDIKNRKLIYSKNFSNDVEPGAHPNFAHSHLQVRNNHLLAILPRGKNEDGNYMFSRWDFSYNLPYQEVYDAINEAREHAVAPGSRAKLTFARRELMWSNARISKVKHTENAKKLLKDAYEENESHNVLYPLVRMCHYLGEMYLTSGKKKEKLPDLYRRVGDGYTGEGKYELARKCYLAESSFTPKAATPYRLIARTYSSENKYKKAVEVLLNAVHQLHDDKQGAIYQQAEATLNVWMKSGTHVSFHYLLPYHLRLRSQNNDTAALERMARFSETYKRYNLDHYSACSKAMLDILIDNKRWAVAKVTAKNLLDIRDPLPHPSLHASLHLLPHASPFERVEKVFSQIAPSSSSRKMNLLYLIDLRIHKANAARRVGWGREFTEQLEKALAICIKGWNIFESDDFALSGGALCFTLRGIASDDQ